MKFEDKCFFLLSRDIKALQRWLVGMYTAPDTPGRLCGALYRSSFEWLNFGTRGVQKKPDFFLDPVHLEPIERDDLVLVVH